MLPFVKIMVNVVDRVNNDTEKIKSAERAEEDILDEWSSELDRVTLALKKLNIMFDRFTNGDLQSRLKQRTDDDIEDVGDNLDKVGVLLP
ncbi:unnamed protein product [Aspergillus oryzae var. brunneus]|uniref:Unnamed protein product n=2 Tax=Aspergillus oryzae TaxID=5062 RepID=A0AAN4YXI2_ASPOZ|nr:unnamed protein product [Aspergillus oryzae]GMG36109.1 unnamed protein product [Aspergillus oryzae]GMG42876.1 unnamed protein product [Aspergillus oryzae var. brunneus]